MEISNDMLDHYLDYVTVGWFDRNDTLPDDINDYYNCVMDIKLDATRRNDLEPLRMGLEYLLCNPQVSLEAHGYRYPYDDGEVREIIRYIRKTIWPEAGPINCDAVKDLKLVYTSKFDWWEQRIAQGLHPPDLRGN
jgi:hypothetical protein